jgi:leucyl aminopeptidase
MLKFSIAPSHTDSHTELNVAKLILIRMLPMETSPALDLATGILSISDKAATMPDFERLVCSLMPILEALDAKRIAIEGDITKMAHWMRAFHKATYRYEVFKSAPKPSNLQEVLFITEPTKGTNQILAYETAVLKGMNLTQDLVNGPSNFVTPDFMAKQALALEALSRKIKVEILPFDKLKELGMNLFCGVAQGSMNKGCLVLIEYRGAGQNDPIHALIGKGITFDSGGLSLKPMPSMSDMHNDMGGSAAVLGAVRSAVELGLRVNVVAALAMAENMPDGEAQRPADILKAYNGKTVKILNTDAEGRLVLADTLSYVEKRYAPASMIDVATLTGAQRVALGTQHAALFSNNESLSKALLVASDAGADPVWRMPLTAEHTRMLNDLHADLANISTPAGAAGCVTAAAFLEQFIAKTTAWAHIDIAGPVKEGDYATGRPVPLFVSYLKSLEN